MVFTGDDPQQAIAERTAGGHINLTGYLNHGNAAVETVVQEQPIRHVSCVHGSFLLTGGRYRTRRRCCDPVRVAGVPINLVPATLIPASCALSDDSPASIFSSAICPRI